MSKCWLWFHDWGKWVDVTFKVRSNLAGIGMSPLWSDEEYETDGQKRVCSRCGKKQQKVLK
jgi:hypothetical protein